MGQSCALLQDKLTAFELDSSYSYVPTRQSGTSPYGASRTAGAMRVPLVSVPFSSVSTTTML